MARGKVKWWRWIGLFLLACPIGLCVLGWGLVQSAFSESASKLEEERKLAKEQGLPLSAEDMRRHVKPEENAALLYRELLPKLKLDRAVSQIMTARRRSGSAKPGAAVKPEDVAKADLWMASHSAELDALEQATKKQHCDFEKDYSEGAALRFDEFSQSRDAARALVYRAESRFAQGHLDSGCESLAAAERLADHMMEEPTIIALLVGTAIYAESDSALYRLLQSRWKEPAVLARAERMLNRRPKALDMRSALKGEVVFGQIEIPRLKNLNALRNLGTEGGDLPIDLPIPKITRDAWQAEHLAHLRKLYQAMPADNNVKTARNVMSEADQKLGQSPRTAIDEIMLPVFSGMPSAAGTYQARNHILSCSLRLLKMRAAGALPGKLPDWGIDSRDPFTEEMFHYKKVGSGFVLYSVGMDGKDDGGQERNSKDGGSDIVRRYD